VRVPILMYHSVAERPAAETRRLAVRPGDLADQLGHLRDSGFTPLSFSDLAAALRDNGSALPARPIVITFDDGYADFHTEALPLLDELGFATTLFVTTGWLHDAGPHAAGRPLDRMLTWSQVKEAAAHRVEVAGHSHSHPQLDQIGDAALREELVCNKALLEDEVGRPVTTMAYPFGYFNTRVQRAVAAAGYEAACAVDNAVAAGPHDRFAMPRLTVDRGTTMTKFQAAVAGRGVPALYLTERTLTKGYAVVRRARWALRRCTSGLGPR
jgi:peptidoglycan/xylan/chitin deacetylase (PgdA/CDA1 family)